MPGASFGVAIYPDDAATKAVLINNADLAMYRAKGSIAQSICFYEPAMDLIVRARRSLAADLRRAVADNQLSIHYRCRRRSRPARSAATRRCCAGSTRRSARFRPPSSFRSPRKTA